MKNVSNRAVLQHLVLSITDENYFFAFRCSAMFLDLANLSAITIALPTLQKEFNISTGDLQWIISAYALTVRGCFYL